MMSYPLLYLVSRLKNVMGIVIRKGTRDIMIHAAAISSHAMPTPAKRDDSVADASGGGITLFDGDRPAVRRASVQTALFYDPPYESELDDWIARHLVAYLAPAATLEYKASVWTPWMRCRFDFLIDLGTRRVAIDYTDTPEHVHTALVEDNDALALGSGNVDAIFRVRRRDLENRLFDVLHLIAKWDAALFTPYGRRIFAGRASEAVRGAHPSANHDLAVISYAAPVILEEALDEPFEWPADETVDDLVVRRLGRENPGYWQRQYERASLVYGMKWVMRKLETA